VNILLWTFQVLLALHTAIGAVWKFSNSEQAVPSLSAIPHPVWLGMSVVELILAVALVLPALRKELGFLAPVAAILVAVEMLLLCAVHLASGNPNPGELVYWLVVAAVCAFIAWGRLALSPIKPR